VALPGCLQDLGEVVQTLPASFKRASLSQIQDSPDRLEGAVQNSTFCGSSAKRSPADRAACLRPSRPREMTMPQSADIADWTHFMQPAVLC
jgi:hypothetical protein